MINPINRRITGRRTRTALVGLTLAGGAVVGATGVVNAASDGVVDGDQDATEAQFLQVEPGDDTTGEERREERRAARQERREARQADRAELASLLGLEADDLVAQIRAGSTLADVAEAQGVDVSAVVDLIVEQKTEKLDAAVENGRLTQAEADEKAAELDERVQTRVDEGRPDRGDRGPRGGGDGAPVDGEG